MAELNHRSTGPTIRRLQELAGAMVEEELRRLFNKLGDEANERTRREIQNSVKRLVNKLLHPPLESLRDEAERGTHHGLLDALKRLFQIHDRE
jgi:glutamyl-tRNA reductase